MRKRIFNILDSSVAGGLAGRIAGIILISLIVISSVASILASIQSFYSEHYAWFNRLEIFAVTVFSIEYVLRIWACVESPDPRFRHRPIKGRVRYALTPLLLIDLLAILPFYLGLWISADLIYLRVIRLFRLLKLTRYSPAMGLLLTVLRKEAGAFGTAFFIMLFLLVFTSGGMYLVENEAQPDNFGSIPAAMWWAVSALTTVGYGDVTPITGWGKFFGACVTIIGVGMVALPTGILASAFSNELRLRREKYADLVEAALSDGEINRNEQRELEEKRLELGIDNTDAEIIEGRIEKSAEICPHCGKPLN